MDNCLSNQRHLTRLAPRYRAASESPALLLIDSLLWLKIPGPKRRVYGGFYLRQFDEYVGSSGCLALWRRSLESLRTRFNVGCKTGAAAMLAGIAAKAGSTGISESDLRFDYESGEQFGRTLRRYLESWFAGLRRYELSAWEISAASFCRVSSVRTVGGNGYDRPVHRACRAARLDLC